MLTLAALILTPGGVIAWILVGLLAGCTASLVTGGGGYGVLGDMLLGLLGSLVGGFVTSLFVQGEQGFWGTMLISILGAVILIVVFRALATHRISR